MSEKIRKGIEAAESDLNKEKEQREQDEVSCSNASVAITCKYAFTYILEGMQ